MQTTKNPVQLYFEMPKYFYSKQKLLLCCGYSQFEFEQVQLWANNQLVAESKAIPHYLANDGKTLNRAFAITGYLKQIDEHKKILFSLHFKTTSGNIEYEISTADIKIPIKKVDAQKPSSIAIALPTYQPNLALFKQQINSILAQNYVTQQTKPPKQSIEIIIQDDDSDEETIQQIKQFIQQIENIHFFQNEKNVGFYNNIESLLYRIGKGFSYIAFSDQDDIWDSQKLEKQVDQLLKNKADLVYSDLEIVNEKLQQLQPSFWVNRSNHIYDYHALCINNVATGSTMLFKNELLSTLLPFPQQTGKVYHDHWIAAFLKNKHYRVHYINESLVQYIQHGDNVTGFKPFKKLNLAQRALSLFSLIFIFGKIIFKKDLTDLSEFITLHQKVYFTNVQRLKIFYVHLEDLNLLNYNSIKTNIILLFRLFFLSFKTIFKPLYLNRFEVSMYSAIIVMFALQLRHFFNKKNG